MSALPQVEFRESGPVRAYSRAFRPMPKTELDLQLVPKEGEPVEGRNFRQPLPRLETERIAADRAVNAAKASGTWGACSVAFELAQQNREHA